MKRQSAIWCTILVLSIAQSYSIADEEKAPKREKVDATQEKATDASAAAMALLEQAGQLVHYARENRSPMAMLTAVEMFRRVPVQDGKKRFGVENTDAAKEDNPHRTVSDSARALNRHALLQEARAMAADNANMLTLIDAEMAKASPSPVVTMGRVWFPFRHVAKVHGGKADTYTITFRGGKLARVLVMGDGDTNLDLYVYDSEGREVARAVDDNCNCVAKWTPRRTGKFRVCIVNKGKVENDYSVISN